MRSAIPGSSSQLHPQPWVVAMAAGHLITVVLTGGGSDATDGVQAVKTRGGIVIAQDPATAEYSGMPLAAVQTGAVDYVLPLEAIGPAIDSIVHGLPIGERAG